MTLFKQSLTIFLSIFTIFVILNTPLSDYITQILALLILFSVIYIVVRRRSTKGEELFVGSLLEVFAITLAILLVIFLTDGIHSNLFFLLYFLLFGIAFMFEPITVFLFIAGLVILFLKQTLEGEMFSNLIRLGSLLLLSPIAFFFGREFKRRKKLEQTVSEKTDKIIEDVKDIASQRGQQSTRELEDLEDIIEESDELKNEAQKE